MTDYRKMDDQALMGELALKTADYMKMYTGNADTGNIQALRNEIKAIQEEINWRKQQKNNADRYQGPNELGNSYA